MRTAARPCEASSSRCSSQIHRRQSFAAAREQRQSVLRSAVPDRTGRSFPTGSARLPTRAPSAAINDAHHHSGLSYLTPAAVHYGRAATVLTVRHRTRLAAYAAHPERFAPRATTSRNAATVWINRPPKPTREDAPGATPVTPRPPVGSAGHNPSVTIARSRSSPAWGRYSKSESAQRR